MPDAYENVVVGKLKLKGKPLDVMSASGGIAKKKNKKNKKNKDRDSSGENKQADDSGDLSATASGHGNGKEVAVLSDPMKEEEDGVGDGKSSSGNWYDHLTPAERRYVEQRERIDMRRLAKTANKSHRHRIEDFNQYLANMSEHYDIPKVGPG